MAEHGKIGTYTNHGCRCDLCRSAWREWNSVYRLAKPDSHRRSTRKRRASRRAFALSYLGGKCQVCGSTERLEFHHRDPNTKNDSISNLLTFKHEALVAELEKCELLCREHHLQTTLAEGRLTGRPPGPAVHGTTTMYRARGCRCDECCAWMRSEGRRYHARRQARLANP